MKKEIRQDIKDICLELIDVGIYPDYEFIGHGNVFIKKGFQRLIYYDDVEDVVERLKHYMDINGYSTKITKVYSLSRSKFLERIINKYKGKVYKVNLDFTNRDIDKWMDEFLWEPKSWDIISEPGFTNFKEKKS